MTLLRIFLVSEVRSEIQAGYWSSVRPGDWRRRFRTSSVPPHYDFRHGSVQLADLLRELSGAAFFRFDANQPPERRPTEGFLGVPDAKRRNRRDNTDCCGWRHVHHGTAQHGDGSRREDGPAALDLYAEHSAGCDHYWIAAGESWRRARRRPRLPRYGPHASDRPGSTIRRRALGYSRRR